MITLHKKLTLVILAAMMAILMAGCGEDAPGQNDMSFLSSLTTAMQSRIEANRRLVEEMKVAGILDAETHAALLKHLKTQEEMYLRMEQSPQASDVQLIRGATVGFYYDTSDVFSTVHQNRDAGLDQYTDDTKHNSTKYITGGSVGHWAKDTSPALMDKWPNPTVRGSAFSFEGEWHSAERGWWFVAGPEKEDEINPKVSALSLIDPNHAERFNEILDFDLYILKTREDIIGGLNTDSALSGGSLDDNQMISLNAVFHLIEDVVNDPGQTGAISKLSYFFKPALNEDGSIMKYYDFENPDNDLLPPVGRSVDLRGSGATSGSGMRSPNRPGWDLRIQQTVSACECDTCKADNTLQPATREVMQLRLYELNEGVIRSLIGTAGGEGRKAFVVPSADSSQRNRIYLMEYPVNVLQEIKKDNDKYTTEWTDSSSLVVNLMDRTIRTSSGTIITQQMNDYITLGGLVDSASDIYFDGDSSFFIMESKPLTLPNGKIYEDAGSIGLRDYLEFSYIPDVVAGEKLVAAGRKIRLRNFGGNISNTFAKYYSAEQNILEGTESIDLFAYDFGDIEAIYGSTPTLKRLGSPGMASGIISEGSTGGAEDEEDEAEGSIGDGASALRGVPIEVVDSIRPTSRFPGSRVGIVDNNAVESKDRMIFHGMFVSKDPFETGLLGGWINQGDATKNSTRWWMHWLEYNKFNYKLNNNAIEHYFNMNFAWELSQEGNVILDLETVAELQSMYEKEKSQNTVRWLRTTFIILGVLLVMYGVMIVLAWTFDTSLDLGVNLMQKLSFGRWMAVKDMEELPHFDDEKFEYMGLSKTLQVAFIIAVLGIVFIFVDTIKIIMFIVEIFGTLASLIEKSFFNR